VLLNLLEVSECCGTPFFVKGFKRSNVHVHFCIGLRNACLKTHYVSWLGYERDAEGSGAISS
jgi:hypothetical protein